MLRRATQAGILAGWQGPHWLGPGDEHRSYTVAPAAAPAGEWPVDDVVAYVETLQVAGIEPLYRASEPL
jgi:hypothetical protein